MSNRATGTFDVHDMADEPYDDRDGVRLARARLRKTFHGEVRGESTVEFLTAMAPENSAAYVGLERIVGTVHGRSGSFVLQHSAVSRRGEQSATLTVVPDSGTGELRAMRGEARIDIGPDGGHSYTLDYELG